RFGGVIVVGMIGGYRPQPVSLDEGAGAAKTQEQLFRKCIPGHRLHNCLAAWIVGSWVEELNSWGRLVVDAGERASLVCDSPAKNGLHEGMPGLASASHAIQIVHECGWIETGQDRHRKLPGRKLGRSVTRVRAY